MSLSVSQSEALKRFILRPVNAVFVAAARRLCCCRPCSSSSVRRRRSFRDKSCCSRVRTSPRLICSPTSAAARLGCRSGNCTAVLLFCCSLSAAPMPSLRTRFPCRCFAASPAVPLATATSASLRSCSVPSTLPLLPCTVPLPWPLLCCCCCASPRPLLMSVLLLASPVDPLPLAVRFASADPGAASLVPLVPSSMQVLRCAWALVAST